MGNGPKMRGRTLSRARGIVLIFWEKGGLMKFIMGGRQVKKKAFRVKGD